MPANKKKKTSESIYLVERIVDMKIVKGRKQYLIKWEGYPNSANTWEDERNVFCKDLVKQFEDSLIAKEGVDSNSAAQNGDATAGSKTPTSASGKRKASEPSPGSSNSTKKKATGSTAGEGAPSGSSGRKSDGIASSQSSDGKTTGGSSTTRTYAASMEAGEHVFNESSKAEEDLVEFESSSLTKSSSSSSSSVPRKLASGTPSASPIKAGANGSASGSGGAASDLAASRSEGGEVSSARNNSSGGSGNSGNNNLSSPGRGENGRRKGSGSNQDEREIVKFEERPKVVKPLPQGTNFNEKDLEDFEHWEEYVDRIQTVERSRLDNSLLINVKWKNGASGLYPASVVNKKCPQLVIKFYENHLRFKSD